MMILRISFLILFQTILFSGMFTACTENPFDGSDEISSKRSVSGTVRLLKSVNSGGVYVWLEGINKGTFTTNDGEFSLNLPPPASQPGGGITGAFNIFYYIANYKLDSTQVILRNGEFLYSQGEIDEKGRLHAPKVLTKLLDLGTEVQPPTINSDYEGTLRVTVTMEVYLDNVALLVIAPDSQLFSIITVKKNDPNNPSLQTLIAPGAPPRIDIFDKGKYVSTADFIMSPFYLSEGDYTIIPYVWVIQNNLPRKLIESLNAPYETYRDEFANIPFKRIGGNFTVIAAKDTTGGG